MTEVDSFESSPPFNRSVTQLATQRDDAATVTVLINNTWLTVFAGGKYSRTVVTNAFEVFNASSQSMVANLSITLSGVCSEAAAVSVGKYVLVMGSYTNVGCKAVRGNVDVIDMEQLTIVKNISISLITPRGGHRAAVLGPYVYVAGGYVLQSAVMK